MSERALPDGARDPEEIATEIADKLRVAMDEIEALQKVLRGEASA